jgi:hypothetical protein
VHFILFEYILYSPLHYPPPLLQVAKSFKVAVAQSSPTLVPGRGAPRRRYVLLFLGSAMASCWDGSAASSSRATPCHAPCSCLRVSLGLLAFGSRTGVDWEGGCGDLGLWESGCVWKIWRVVSWLDHTRERLGDCIGILGKRGLGVLRGVCVKRGAIFLVNFYFQWEFI